MKYSDHIFSANAYNKVKRLVPISRLLRDMVTVGELIKDYEDEMFMTMHSADNMEPSA